MNNSSEKPSKEAEAESRKNPHVPDKNPANDESAYGEPDGPLEKRVRESEEDQGRTK